MFSTFSMCDLFGRMASSEWRIARKTVFYSPFATRPLPSQIHFDDPLVRRNLIDGAFGQHRAFVQARDLDAELADEGHVVLDHHHGLFLVDFLQELGGL